MLELNIVQKITIYAIPILFAITVHEVAHGWVASKLGDPTAKVLGRLTLNPLKHIDLIGTVLVPAMLLFLGGFIFGWAKPVPVEWRNLRNPRRDMALVALAGPGANLCMAFLWAIIAKLTQLLGQQLPPFFVGVLVMMVQAGIAINFVLLVLNLIPIPPLDGSRVVSAFLSPSAGYYYNQIEPFGFIILLLLMVTGVLGKIISQPVMILMRGILGLFGLGT